MSQNVSSAVMQRRAEPHDSLDFFPTPPWASRALCETLAAQGVNLAVKRCWEPACGLGHMVRPLAEYFETVFASDVHPYGHGAVQDFLLPFDMPRFDWIVTNPPFRLAEAFARIAIDRAGEGVALLVRTAFLEGGKRHRALFGVTPPALVLQFVERVPMVKGRVDGTASTATAYCWIVWSTRPHRPVPATPTRLAWLPPCRRRLEKPGDYAEAAE